MVKKRNGKEVEDAGASSSSFRASLGESTGLEVL
jgi:hypothetical protein